MSPILDHRIFCISISGLNTGSFFLRNTEWTWDFLSEVWATKGPHVWMSKDWWEQVRTEGAVGAGI